MRISKKDKNIFGGKPNQGALPYGEIGSAGWGLYPISSIRRHQNSMVINKLTSGFTSYLARITNDYHEII